MWASRQAMVVTGGGVGSGMGVVHSELAAAHRDRRRALAAAAHVPAAGHRLPEVLIVGEPGQPRAELVLPVRFELLAQLGVPVKVHDRHARPLCGQERSAIAGRIRFRGGNLGPPAAAAVTARRYARTGPEPSWRRGSRSRPGRCAATCRSCAAWAIRCYAAPGVAGGYRLGAGAALPPLLLDDDEAVAVALSLRTAASHAVTGVVGGVRARAGQAGAGAAVPAASTRPPPSARRRCR